MSKTPPNKSGPMIIVVGPSGAGKSSFVEQATKDFPKLCDIITFTTRPMRKGESEGQPYHFVSPETFEIRKNEDFFVEWAQVHGNLYGTPRYQLEEAWIEGKVVIMDVDIQGAKTISQKYPSCVTVFVMPPSLDVLRQRVVSRDGGAPKDLELRMQNAKIEMARAEEFDHQVVNDDFTDSYGRFKKIVEAVVNQS